MSDWKKAYIKRRLQKAQQGANLLANFDIPIGHVREAIREQVQALPRRQRQVNKNLPPQTPKTKPSNQEQIKALEVSDRADYKRLGAEALRSMVDDRRYLVRIDSRHEWSPSTPVAFRKGKSTGEPKDRTYEILLSLSQLCTGQRQVKWWGSDTKLSQVIVELLLSRHSGALPTKQSLKANQAERKRINRGIEFWITGKGQDEARRDFTEIDLYVSPRSTRKAILSSNR